MRQLFPEIPPCSTCVVYHTFEPSQLVHPPHSPDRFADRINLYNSIPSCPSSTNTSSLERVVAYYELFQFSRPCDTMQPENIPAGALTHINLGFVQFGDDWKMVDEYGDIVTRVTRLKTSYPGLRVNVAIGGWNFNDPPSTYYFSNMAGSYENRQTFINSLISYLQKYGLDGVEIGRLSSSVPLSYMPVLY